MSTEHVIRLVDRDGALVSEQPAVSLDAAVGAVIELAERKQDLRPIEHKVVRWQLERPNYAIDGACFINRDESKILVAPAGAAA